MGELGQVAAVTALNLRTIPARRGSSLVVVIGMAAVVAVVTSVLSMSTGFLQSIGKTGSPSRAIVMSSGANYVATSSLTRDSIPPIVDAPGVQRDRDGRPIATTEFDRPLYVVKKSDGLDGWISVKGVGPYGFALMPRVRLVAGRMFNPALHELIVGRLAQTQYEGLAVGDKVALPSGDWTIVGAFESGGDQHESEMIGDVDSLLSAFRAGAFNAITVQLQSPAAFQSFKDALTSNPSLKVDVEREDQYYARLAKPFTDYLSLIAYYVGGIMALGAVFGALNTMYTAVSTRSREIATLRAIGFGAAPVVISVLAEALLLTILGAVLGAGLAWLAFNGRVVVSSGSVFALAVTPTLFALAVAWGLAVGMVGGLIPAIRAARTPIAAGVQMV